MEAGIVLYWSGEGARSEATVGVLAHCKSMTDIVIQVIQYTNDTNLPLKRNPRSCDRYRAVQALMTSWARGRHVLIFNCSHDPDPTTSTPSKTSERGPRRRARSAASLEGRNCYVHNRIEIMLATTTDNRGRTSGGCLE